MTQYSSYRAQRIRNYMESQENVCHIHVRIYANVTHAVKKCIVSFILQADSRTVLHRWLLTF